MNFSKIRKKSPLFKNKEACPICRDTFALGNDCMTTPCNHSFHAMCLIGWMKESDDCPYCRGFIGNGERRVQHQHEDEDHAFMERYWRRRAERAMLEANRLHPMPVSSILKVFAFSFIAATLVVILVLTANVWFGVNEIYAEQQEYLQLHEILKFKLCQCEKRLYTIPSICHDFCLSVERSPSNPLAESNLLIKTE